MPVHYDKNAFEYSDRAWKAAIDYLRGEAPLQPEKAKAAHYSENTSPAGQIVQRISTKRRRSALPDPRRRVTAVTRRDASVGPRKFWAGDPDYQTDEKWWDQVLAHEARQKQAKLDKATGDTTGGADEAAVLAALGVTSRSRYRRGR